MTQQVVVTRIVLGCCTALNEAGVGVVDAERGMQCAVVCIDMLGWWFFGSEWAALSVSLGDGLYVTQHG